MQDYAGSITTNPGRNETTIDVAGVGLGIFPTFTAIDGGVSLTLVNSNIDDVVGVFEGIVTKLKALGSGATTAAASG